jgi:hypothetical protein
VALGPLPIPLGASVAEAATTVNVNIFFDALAPNGVWVKHPKYRYVFCPRVDAKWRPYSRGHWIYIKDWGWYFASNEPFAWAVYHYGRWFKAKNLGWCWVPGNAWAGAWVSWRRGNDYVGWAPLEPTRDGFSVDVDISNAEPPQPDWVFVPTKRFLQPKLDVEIVFGDQKPEVFQQTQFVGPVVVQNNIVVNNVIDVNFIQQQTNTQVVVVNPKAVDDPKQAAADVSGTDIAVFAPQIAPPKQDEAPSQAVDEAQAAAQLGGGTTSEQPSSSSEQPSSAASSSEAPSQASSAASSEMTSSAAASAPSSEASSSAAPSSSEGPSSQASSSAKAPSSSAISSSEAASSAASSAAPSEASSAASSAAPESSSAGASSEPATSSAAPSSEEAAPSSEPQASSSLECPEGYQIVKGKCVPIESSSAQ